MAGKSIRVFLDSNVVLSGLLSDSGPPRVVLDLICARIPGLHAMTGDYNLAEIDRTLRRKLPRALPAWRRYRKQLSLEIIPLPNREEVDRYRGTIADKDVPVLVSAINGKCDLLVTGDRKDFGPLVKKSSFPFRIVSPAICVELLAGWMARQEGSFSNKPDEI
jgi:predicted nucleic acid-binding protein